MAQQLPLVPLLSESVDERRWHCDVERGPDSLFVHLREIDPEADAAPEPVNAMQLDINPNWVQLDTAGGAGLPLVVGGPGTEPTARPVRGGLDPGLLRGAGTDPGATGKAPIRSRYGGGGGGGSGRKPGTRRNPRLSPAGAGDVSSWSRRLRGPVLSDRTGARSVWTPGPVASSCMVVSTAPPSPLEARRRFGHHAEALMEMLLGCFLLGVATLAGLVFVHRPWPNRVDAFGFRLLPADLSSRWAADVAHLGSLTVLIAGAAVLCVAGGLSGNRMRAVSCLIAPIGALLIVQSVAKPLVGRHFEGTTALSYPSGTVAAVAALAAAHSSSCPGVRSPRLPWRASSSSR